MCRLLVIILTIAIFFPACSGSKEASKTSKSVVSELPEGAEIDSVDYFTNDYTVVQVANERKIQGKWDVMVMYRSNAGYEKLSDITLTLAGSAFAGNAPCNSIAGNYELQGYRIRFKDVVSTKMACNKLDQENTYLTLLQNNVNSFAFQSSKLLLKDHSGNIVFECVKE